MTSRWTKPSSWAWARATSNWQPKSIPQGDGKRAGPLDPLRRAAPVNVPHHEEHQAPGHPRLVEADDVRVVEAAQDPHVALEFGPPGRGVQGNRCPVRPVDARPRSGQPLRMAPGNTKRHNN